jgi:PPOX class probable F420-dependent enzyme
MAEAIPAGFRDLFEKKALAHLATLMPNGSPQSTPVWVDLHGGFVRVNSAKGRLKDKNMRRDARVALSIQDPDNLYRYLEVRGRVAEITESGADAHIDSLAKKYMGVDQYPLRKPGEQRVIYIIEPLRFSTMG